MLLCFGCQMCVTVSSLFFLVLFSVWKCFEHLIKNSSHHCPQMNFGGKKRIVEWPGLKRTTMIFKFQPPCYVQGHQPPDQAAQGHIQPGLECFQGWGVHNLLLGQPVQCVTTLCVKKFLLISNLNLSCLSLKPFPLVLLLSALVNSHSCSFLYAPFKYWKATMRSPWIFLFSKLNNPSSLNLSS